MLSSSIACYQECLWKEELVVVANFIASLISRNCHTTIAFRSHHLDQSEAINTEAKPSTSKMSRIHWRLKWLLVFYGSKSIFWLRSVHCFFTHNAICILDRWKHAVNITFMPHLPKYLCDLLYFSIILLWWFGLKPTISLRHAYVQMVVY